MYPKKIRKKGHVSNPIASHGILAYSRNEKKEPLFLLYKRRDSFEYAEFMRGLWSNYDDLKRIFSGITQEERERIKNYVFKELWDDFWISKHYRVYKDAYPRAETKYEAARFFIPQLLNETIPILDNVLWGFPKGKKNGHEECNIVCAMREFEEETRIPTVDMKIIPNIVFSEIYKGTDSKDYSTEYFLAYMSIPIVKPLIELKGCIRKETISDEASDTGWFTFNEAYELLDESKRRILTNALWLLEE